MDDDNGGEEEEEIESQGGQHTASTTGLGTNLKPNKINLTAPKGTELLEEFLKAVEDEVLDLAFQYSEKQTMTPRSQQVKSLQQSLKKDIYHAVVPTDKTNSFRVMEVDEYSQQVLEHLKKSGKEIPRSRLIEVEEQANNLLEQIQNNLTENEAAFIRQTLKSKAIPSPKLLIKDHKKVGKNGKFPTRLVVPANNFTSAFPRMGYLGIKKILDDNRINYMKKTIIQASDLKEKIETMNITNHNSTILSIDAEAYCWKY